jgi:hypothetical protein
VPEVRHEAFHYPLLACEIFEIIPRHFGWVDPIRSHSYYNMSEDVRILLKDKQGNEAGGPALSIVRHYYTDVQLEPSSVHASENVNDGGYGAVAFVSRPSKNLRED